MIIGRGARDGSSVGAGVSCYTAPLGPPALMHAQARTQKIPDDFVLLGARVLHFHANRLPRFISASDF